MVILFTMIFCCCRDTHFCGPGLNDCVFDKTYYFLFLFSIVYIVCIYQKGWRNDSNGKYEK